MTSRSTGAVIRSSLLWLLRAIGDMPSVRRLRDRLGRIGKKLLIVGYVYVGIVVTRALLRLVFGWEV